MSKAQFSETKVQKICISHVPVNCLITVSIHNGNVPIFRCALQHLYFIIQISDVLWRLSLKRMKLPSTYEKILFAYNCVNGGNYCATYSEKCIRNTTLYPSVWVATSGGPWQKLLGVIEKQKKIKGYLLPCDLFYTFLRCSLYYW